MEYVPEGGGSHHWKVLDQQGQTHFVTVDDLDDKDWMASTRESAFSGFTRALRTAATLRYEAGLTFVVAPIPARGGDLLHRIDGRYTVSLYPYLVGRSHRFGPYVGASLRNRALDMIVALHQATPAVRGLAPPHAPRYAGRSDLDTFLADPGRPWNAGPYSEAARQTLAPRSADLVRLVAGFDRLVETTAPAREHLVVTHGEPHPANVMSVDGRLFLIDWDTVALAPPERDLSLLATTSGDGLDRYQEATGHRVDRDVIILYRLRWYLDDLASAVRLFRNAHEDTADTRRWSAGLASQLEKLSTWLGMIG